MKKTYNQPTCLVVELASRNAMLISASGTETLGGTRYGGSTTDNSISGGDVKGMSDVNLWDNEW